jgi:SAM-dependent methyltransferase
MNFAAFKYCFLFVLKYLQDLPRYADKIVVEYGSAALDPMSSFRSIFMGYRYIGVDIQECSNVDLIIKDDKIPLPDGSVDVVVSSSCFEHSEFFWESFLEMVRIVKPGGYIHLSVPSSGAVHRHPVDCWRFYPDSGKALVNYAKKNGYTLELVESFIENDPSPTEPSWGLCINNFKRV